MNSYFVDLQPSCNFSKLFLEKHHISALTLPAPSELAGSDAVYQINNDGTINATRKVVSDDNEDDAPLATWPHACVYVAWALTWAAVLLSGFFAILYR